MLYIGASGYSYDDWKGRFYPPTLPRDQMLDYYADRFNAVEINATFYRIPPLATMRTLLSRAADRLCFAIKANQALTHQGDRTPATCAAMLRVIEPIRDAGRLGAILFQFPFRFHCTSENRARIGELARSFSGLPLAVEIRHNSWDRPEGWSFFRDRGLSRCVTDLPRLSGLPAPSTELTGPIAYVRLHGRNAAKWFNAERPSDPYDYHYGRDELASWVDPVRAMERSAETAFVFFNNHIHGQAPDNARVFSEMLGLPPGPEPYRDLFSL
jgi:uncharacterized protein YecE (DUF72 family)